MKMEGMQMYINNIHVYKYKHIAYKYISMFINIYMYINVYKYVHRQQPTWQIPCDGFVSAVSFNPHDSSKILVTGSDNLFKFWRIVKNGLSSAAIAGLQKGNHKYTCQAWLGENRVIAGTDGGFLAIADGCEQLSSIQYAFGSPDQPGSRISEVYYFIYSI